VPCGDSRDAQDLAEDNSRDWLSAVARRRFRLRDLRLGYVLVPLRAVGGVGTGLTASACYYMYSLEDQQRNAAPPCLRRLPWLSSSLRDSEAGSLMGLAVSVYRLGVLLIPCFLLAREFSAATRSRQHSTCGSPAAPPVVLWLGLLSSALFNVAVAYSGHTLSASAPQQV